ncbi:MAG: hypothetical protein ABWU11_23855, partial [Arthrospira platensis]
RPSDRILEGNIGDDNLNSDISNILEIECINPFNQSFATYSIGDIDASLNPALFLVLDSMKASISPIE